MLRAGLRPATADLTLGARSPSSRLCRRGLTGARVRMRLRRQTVEHPFRNLGCERQRRNGSAP